MSKPSRLFQENEPLYRQLERTIRKDISSGIYPVHSKIPSEMELAEKYSVSRVTVRKALAELAEEGLLVPQQGRGTYVSVPVLVRNLRAVNSFHDTCRMMGTSAGARVLKAHTVPANEDDAAKLMVSADELVVEIVRVRTADDTPVMLEINHFPGKYEYLLNDDMTGSVYGALEEHGVSVGQGIHEISLAHASLFQAENLQLSEGDALLRLKEVIYDTNGLPLHTSDQFIRGDRFTFRI